jgi:hypothetical protein
MGLSSYEDKIRNSRWGCQRIVLAAILLLFLLATVFYRPMLRGVGGLLVVNEPGAPVEFLCIPPMPGFDVGEDRCYDRAVGCFHQIRGTRFLLAPGRPNRLVEMGLLPRFEITASEALRRRGIAAARIESLVGVKESPAQEFAPLEHWLNGHPRVVVGLFWDELDSRRARLVLDRDLQPRNACRVRLIPLPQKHFSAANWWTHHSGRKYLPNALLALISAWCGLKDEHLIYRNADAYEDFLARRLGEK